MAIQQHEASALEPPRPRLPVVAIVACAGFAPFQLSTPLAIFGSLLDVPLFETRLCGLEGRTLRNEFGMVLHAAYGLEGLANADLIVVPFWRSPGERPPQDLLKALRDGHQRGAKIVGLCLGSYVLAYAGLLDSRDAATHKELVDDFRRRFPRVRLDANALFVDSDSVLTSAGMGAGIDCCLAVVRSTYGIKVANRIAQRLAVPFHFEGHAAQFVRAPASDSAEVTRLQSTLEFVAQNLSVPHTVNTLAARACMSRRSFTRHFSKATQTSLGRWLLARRLQEAQFLLETTQHRTETVADLVGFPSVVSFRRHFKAELGASPNDWRRAKPNPRPSPRCAQPIDTHSAASLQADSRAAV